MDDRKPGAKSILTDAEDASVVAYIMKCAVLGAGLTRFAADLKLKRILEARGAKWDTTDGL